MARKIFKNLFKEYSDLKKGYKKDKKFVNLPKKRFSVLTKKGKFVDEFQLNKRDLITFKKKGYKLIPVKNSF